MSNHTQHACVLRRHGAEPESRGARTRRRRLPLRGDAARARARRARPPERGRGGRRRSRSRARDGSSSSTGRTSCRSTRRSSARRTATSSSSRRQLKARSPSRRWPSTDGCSPSSVQSSRIRCGRLGIGERVVEREERHLDALGERAQPAFSASMSFAARLSPLIHGSTSTSATRRPSPRARQTMPVRFLSASSTGRDCTMSLIPPWMTSASAPSTAASRRCGDLVGALAVHAVVPEVEARVGAHRPPLPLAALVRASRCARAPPRRDPRAASRR